MIRVSMGRRVLAPALLIALLVPGLTAMAQTQPPFQDLSSPPPDKRDNQDKMCQAFWDEVGKGGWNPLDVDVDVDVELDEDGDGTFTTTNITLTLEEKAECFFQQTRLSLVRAVRTSIGNDQVSIANELLGDVQGPLRISFGNVLSDYDEEDAPEGNEALESFFAAGGNAFINFSYPMMDLNPRGYARLTLYALPRVGFTLPELGSELEDPTWNVDLAIEPHLWLFKSEDTFQFFVQLRAGYVLGADRFYEGIGMEDDGGFYFGQWAAGVLLKDFVAISLNGPLIAPDELTEGLSTRLSVMMLPKIKVEGD